MKNRRNGIENAVVSRSAGRVAALAIALGLSLPTATASFTGDGMTAYAFNLFGTAAQGQEAAATEETGYVFKSGDTEIQMGAEAASVLAALGQPIKPVFEQDSCAYQGKDKVYTYTGFELSTYQKNGKDYIASVYILDAAAGTPEGIKVGSSAGDVLKTYGTAQEEMGVYRYTKGNAELSVYTTKGVVDAIEYMVVQA